MFLCGYYILYNVHVHIIDSYVNVRVKYLSPRDTAGRMKEEALRNNITMLHKQASFTVMISARPPLIIHTEWLISVYEGREDEIEMIHALHESTIYRLSSKNNSIFYIICDTRKQFKGGREILSFKNLWKFWNKWGL